jgi:GrpB-like predicted nucleotidyltransferase (UPF0157 family)
MPEQVFVAPYDPDWPRRFEAERAILAALFEGTEAAIEHIGSTAVPGLGAKPVIDVLVGVRALVEAERLVPRLEAAGYEYVPEYERELAERRYFRKPPRGPRAVHVHCVVKESALWIRYLACRDQLRAHPASAAAYDELKRDLAVRLTKHEYAKAKDPFVERVLVAARGEALTQRSSRGLSEGGR